MQRRYRFYVRCVKCWKTGKTAEVRADECCPSETSRDDGSCCLTHTLRRRQISVEDFDPHNRERFTVLHWACFCGTAEVRRVKLCLCIGLRLAVGSFRCMDLIAGGRYRSVISGRTKKKAVGDDTKAPKVSRLRRRVLHGKSTTAVGEFPFPQ